MDLGLGEEAGHSKEKIEEEYHYEVGNLGFRFYITQIFTYYSVFCAKWYATDNFIASCILIDPDTIRRKITRKENIFWIVKDRSQTSQNIGYIQYSVSYHNMFSYIQPC